MIAAYRKLISFFDPDPSDRHQPIQSVSATGAGSHKDRAHYVPPDKAGPFLALSR